jgi:hypothetical protein
MIWHNDEFIDLKVGESSREFIPGYLDNTSTVVQLNFSLATTPNRQAVLSADRPEKGSDLSCRTPSNVSAAAVALQAYLANNYPLPGCPMPSTNFYSRESPSATAHISYPAPLSNYR